MALIQFGIGSDAGSRSVLAHTFLPNSFIYTRRSDLTGFRLNIEITVPPGLFWHGGIDRIPVVSLIVFPLNRPVKNLMMNITSLIHLFGQRVRVLLLSGMENISLITSFIFEMFFVGGISLLAIWRTWGASNML